MERPQLIASDVDGTLLTPLEEMTRRTIDVVHRVHAEDVPFILVSGRPPRWIPHVAKVASITGYAVCANGAAIYDIAADRVVSSHGLEPSLLRDAADALGHALPGARLAAERVAGNAHDEAVPQFVSEASFRNPWGDGESHVVTRAEVLGRTAVKLLVSDLRMRSDEMAQMAREVLSDAVTITYSSNGGLIELSPLDVTKASGLTEVCGWLEVDAADVVAFGDMPNDVEMLRWAGHGVAMANAHPEALGAADEVTAANTEDGVAQVLERWFT